MHETHQLRLHPKTKLPVLTYVPKPPSAKPSKLTEAWKEQARIFARYFLVLFRPWVYSCSNGSLPGSLSWNSFCSFVKMLEDGNDGNGPSFFDVLRMKWIRNTSHGLRTNSTDKQQFTCLVGEMRRCRTSLTTHLCRWPGWSRNQQKKKIMMVNKCSSVLILFEEMAKVYNVTSIFTTKCHCSMDSKS